MNFSKRIKLARQAYTETCTDHSVVESVLVIMNDAMSNVWPPDTVLMHSWTVKDVLSKTGWYGDLRFIEYMVGTYQARAIRFICLQYQVPLISPKMEETLEVMKFLKSTDPQTQRVTPLVVAKAIKRYGPTNGMSDSDWDSFTQMMNREIQVGLSM